MNKPAPGDVFEVAYPFVRTTYTEYDEDGLCESESWRPGIEWVMSAPDDSEPVADGVGKMILTVVSTHKPGKFPLRIFYTRKFCDPDGKLFGKGRLHICTLAKFRRLSSRYACEYRIVKDSRELAA